MTTTLAVLWSVLAAAVQAEAPATPARGPADKPAGVKLDNDNLIGMYRGDAARYVIYRDGTRREKVTLRAEPVYLWTNPLRQEGQYGEVFLWTSKGRAEAIGSIFSSHSATGDGRHQVSHELHSLSRRILDVTHPGENTWTPEAPGVNFAPITGAPAPAATPAQRLVQMRNLAREFTGHTVDREEKRWELRLLPRPFYRYESTDPDTVDGAVFAFVTSAGTDPEMILVLEAHRPAPGVAPGWQYGVARFTDLDLWVRHKGAEVFAVAKVVYDAPRQDVKHRYRLFTDHFTAPDPAAVEARKDRSTPNRGEP